MRARASAVLAVVAALAPAGAAAAAEPLPRDTVEARVKFFGAENVDAGGALPRDRIVLSWFGVTNFAMAIDGEVVLLDAWVPRGEHSGYVPTTPEEIAKLKPRYVFVGHAHFDHAADIGTIVRGSGATVVGTQEHCDQSREKAGMGAPVRCVVVAPAGAPPGAMGSADGLLPGVQITTVKHVHSAARGPDGEGLHVPVAPQPSPDTVYENPPTPTDFMHFLQASGDAEGGSLLYQFTVRGFRFTYHDTVGPLPEDAPGVLDVFRRLPPSDIQLSSIQGFNQLTNSMRDVRLYAEALRPKLFVPAHHDDWAPGVTTKGERYEPYLREEIARMPPERRPSVRFLYDPYDYLRPSILTFSVPGPVATLPAAPAAPCRSRRTFRIRLARGLRSARVYVNGRRVRTVRGRRLRAPVDLRGLPRGRFTVRVVGVTRSGRRVVQTRRYVTCVPG